MFGFAASVIQTGTLGKLWVPFTDEEKEESFDWKNYSSDKNWKSQDSIQIDQKESVCGRKERGRRKCNWWLEF